MEERADDFAIEDIPSRCQERFLDGSQCWNAAAKVIKYQGETRVMCIPHMEEWLKKLVERSQR